MITAKQPLIFTSGKRKPLPEGKIKRLTAAVLKKEKIDPSRKINLICCSDYTIRKLNRCYRQVDKITDVLSFFFNDNDLLGEIYISLRRTEVQARRFGVSFNDEFLRLYLHGLLHLAGYDHAGPVETRVMETKARHYTARV